MAEHTVTTRDQCRIASTFDEVGLDQQEWNALAAKSATNSIFQTHQWMRSWWTAYGEGYKPLFVTVSCGDRVRGVAPLIIDHRRSWQRTVRFLGNGRADYCDILGGSDHREVLDAVLGALCAHDGWHVIKLSNVPSASPTVEALPEVCSRLGLHIVIGEQDHCPSLVVRGNEDSVRQLFNKPSLRRPHNYFKRQGNLVSRDLATRDEIEPRLEAFFAQHVARHKLSGHDSLFGEPRNRQLYRELTANLDGTGWLVFSVVELDGQPIACHYGFDYDGVVTWYNRRSTWHTPPIPLVC